MKIVGDINCFESIEQIKNQKVKLANDELAEHEGKDTAILFSYIKMNLQTFNWKTHFRIKSKFNLSIKSNSKWKTNRIYK